MFNRVYTIRNSETKEYLMYTLTGKWQFTHTSTCRWSTPYYEYAQSKQQSLEKIHNIKLTIEPI